MEERVRRLELQLRAIRRALVVATLFGALVLVAGAAPGRRVVQAEEFILTDQMGRTTAFLGHKEGRTGIWFLNPDAPELVAALGVSAESAVLLLTDKKGTTGLGPTVWQIRNAKDQPRAILGAADDKGTIMLLEKDGKVVFNTP